MPTNRTKRTRNRTPELTEAQVEHLLTGRAVKTDFSYPEDQRKSDWRKYKKSLMKYWISDLKEKYRKDPEKYADEIIGFAMPKGPFTRPAAWWDYNAPEPRHCLNYDESEICCYNDALPCHLQTGNYSEDLKKTRRCLNSGVPFQPLRFKDGQRRVAEFETEKDYLIRLDLLTETESQLLKNGQE